MPFTVDQLRTQMQLSMTASNMLTPGQLATLLNAPNVDAAVNALGAINWQPYWTHLSNWIAGLLGNITMPTANAAFGLILPPILPHVPVGQNLGLITILNDCFDNTWHWMQLPAQFSAPQALANHIRLLRL